MELIRGLHNLRPRHRGCVATIGAFDGVHRGHQAVLGHLLQKSAELQLPSAVILFEPLPREYFAPLQAPPRLMNFREKFTAMKALGIDRVLRIRFVESLRNMGAEAFIERIFADGLGAQYIVVGDDLRFGRDREGDFDLMQRLGGRFGYRAMHTDTLGLSGERVSSTRIRQALAEADFALAEQLLGRPYSMMGKVVYGDRRGRTLGIPTANLELHRLRAPLAGVYVVRVDGAGAVAHPAIANVGTRPTVAEGLRANLEIHLLDFDGELYGKTLTVNFLARIRDEEKFQSLDELKEQLEKDKASGRKYFER